MVFLSKLYGQRVEEALQTVLGYKSPSSGMWRLVVKGGEEGHAHTCYCVLSHICSRAVTCFRLEQVSIAKAQEWQTEFIFLSSSYRLCVSWLHGVPQ